MDIKNSKPLTKYNSKSNLDQVSLLKWSMRLVGIWPGDLCGKHSAFWLIFSILSLLLLLIMGAAMCAYMHQNISDIVVVIDTTCTYSTNVICTLKLAWIIYKRELFCELMDTILNNKILERNPLLEWISVKPSYFAIKLQYTATRLLDANWKEFRIVSNIFFSMVMITACSYVLIPLSLMANTRFNYGYTPRYHIYNVDYSWVYVNVTQTPYYEISFLHESYIGLNIYAVVVGLDGSYCCVVMYLCNQLRLLQHMFTMVDDSIDLPHEKEEIIKTKYERLLHCVRHHEMLIEYRNKLNQAFGPINLFQTLISSILICVIAFRSSIATTDLTNLLIKIPYLLAAIAQLLLYSYYGQTLINESSQLAESLYSTLWYEYPKAFRQYLLIVLPQLQRPLRLNAMGFIVMSLDSFKNILSTAMSYFALLQSITEPEKKMQ